MKHKEKNNMLKNSLTCKKNHFSLVLCAPTFREGVGVVGQPGLGKKFQFFPKNSVSRLKAPLIIKNENYCHLKANAALNNFYSTRRSSLPESAQESGFTLFDYILNILSLCL